MVSLLDDLFYSSIQKHVATGHSLECDKWNQFGIIKLVKVIAK